MGRAGLHRLVAAQRERAGARSAGVRRRAAADRGAQPRRVVQPLPGDGGAGRSAGRRHPLARLPGDPFTGSTYELGERFRAEHGIRMLPTSLRQAIAALDEDVVDPGRARRPHLPRLPRREASRVRALPAGRPPLGARGLPASVLTALEPCV